jgi:hypothetical protein
MVERHESAKLNQKELEEAVKEYLAKKTSSKPEEWTIAFNHSHSTSGHGWGEVDHDIFTANASRKIA